MKKISWLCVLFVMAAVFSLVCIACKDPGNTGPGNQTTEYYYLDETSGELVKVDNPIPGQTLLDKDGNPVTVGGKSSGNSHSVTTEFTEANKETNNGWISIAPAKSIMGTTVNLTPYPEGDRAVTWIKIQLAGQEFTEQLVPIGTKFSFKMPDADVTVTALFGDSGQVVVAGNIIFDGGDGGFKNGGGFYTQTEWVTNGVVVVDPLVGDVTEVENFGNGEGRKAIKISYSKINNVLVVGFRFGGANLAEVDALRFDARTEYTGFDQTPGFGSIAFGKKASGTEESMGDLWYQIEKAVVYTGESTSAGEPIEVGKTYETFYVPNPLKSGTADEVQLRFGAAQIEGVVIYLDNIRFIKSSSRVELVRVELPKTGIIPYADSKGGVLTTDLTILTITTKLQYQFGASRYTFYGENLNPSVTEFQNKFVDWYGASKIVYSVVGDIGTVNGHELRPSGFEKNGELSVSYDGFSSNSDTNTILESGTPVPAKSVMTISTLKSWKTKPASGPMDIASFDEIPGNGYLYNLAPFYSGGDCGDAQWYGGPYLTFYTDDFVNTNMESEGWLVGGTTGLRHDLTGCTSLTINLKMCVGMVYRFSLSSGFDTVPSTLVSVEGNPLGKKKSSYVEIVSTANDYTDYTFSLPGDLKVAEGETAVDLSNVSGYQFYTDRALNASTAAKAGWASDTTVSIEKITAQ